MTLDGRKISTDWRGWKITDEQAQAIFGGDLAARNSFYEGNFIRLRKMAWNYAKKWQLCSMVDDLLQGVYIDMGYFYGAYNKPVKDGKTLSHFVYWSFSKCKDGGLLYLAENDRKLLSWHNSYTAPARQYSLDAPAASVFGRNAEDVEGTLGDILPALAFDDELKGDELGQELVSFLGEVLALRWVELLQDIACGYSVSAAARDLGINEKTARKYMGKIRERLRPFADELAAYAA